MLPPEKCIKQMHQPQQLSSEHSQHISSEVNVSPFVGTCISDGGMIQVTGKVGVVSCASCWIYHGSRSGTTRKQKGLQVAPMSLSDLVPR